MQSRTRKFAESGSRAAANRFDQQPSNQLSPAQRKFDTAQREPVPEEEDLIQGKFATVQREPVPEEEDLIQGKFATVQREPVPEEEDLIQGKFATAQREPVPEEEDLIQGKFQPVQRMEAENKTGMSNQLKFGIESLSGMDMSDVRVHQNSDKPAQLNALAYAQGTDIHVAPGQEKHLAHEAWHVAQQKQGRVQPTTMVNGQNVNDDAGLEAEADNMGAQALQAKMEE